MYFIYRITNNINNKCYIGYTAKSVKKRWQAHYYSRTLTHFHNAIRKYGKKNFSVETLCYGEDDKAGLQLAEPLLIAHYKPEYNHTSGGECGSSSPETRLKISRKLKGKPHSAEWRWKIYRASVRRWYKSKPYRPTTIYMA